MRRQWARVGACALVSWCSCLQAHHSGAVFNLDPEAQIELHGVVVDFKLRSPHASFVLDVADNDGDERDSAVRRWELEWEPVPMLRTIGIDAQTFVAGDLITIRAAPHRDPAFRFAKALRVTDEFGAEYLMADSERLFSPTLRAAAAALTGDSAEEDERPGTTPAVAGATALAGRWQQPLLQFATDGPNLPLNEAGMKAWREYDYKDSPANICEPLSVPSVFLAPFFLFELRVDAQQAVLSNEPYEIVRTVPLDGTTAAVDERGFFGRARGRIRRGTLVVESSGFPCFEVGARARRDARRRRCAVVDAKNARRAILGVDRREDARLRVHAARSGLYDGAVHRPRRAHARSGRRRDVRVQM